MFPPPLPPPLYSIVVSPPSLPITDIRASLLAAAHQAAEVAIRTVKPGAKNWEVTEAIKKVLAEYESVGVKGVEGVLSHQVRFSSQTSLAPLQCLIGTFRFSFPSMNKTQLNRRREWLLSRLCNNVLMETMPTLSTREKSTVLTFLFLIPRKL